jgi:DNA-binding FadR family transcriptional regulator
VESLGTRIINGELKPDLPFPKEADLGKEFGASRSVIREAVKSLAARGLITSQTKIGIRVLEPMHWNLLDAEVLNWRYSTMPPAQFYAELFEIRQMIEPQAAAFAARRGSSREIAAIGVAYDEMETAGRDNQSGIDADLRFHRSILAAGHNALLLQMGNLIAVGLHIAHRISSESFVVFLPQHKAVYDAIRVRDASGAREAMERLLSETYTFMSEHIHAFPSG